MMSRLLSDGRRQAARALVAVDLVLVVVIHDGVCETARRRRLPFHGRPRVVPEGGGLWRGGDCGCREQRGGRRDGRGHRPHPEEFLLPQAAKASYPEPPFPFSADVGGAVAIDDAPVAGGRLRLLSSGGVAEPYGFVAMEGHDLQRKGQMVAEQGRMLTERSTGGW